MLRLMNGKSYMCSSELTRLLEQVQARSASIRVEGDRLAIYNASKLTPELKEEIRRLKPQLLSTLRDKPGDDYDPVVAKALELFGGRAVEEMPVAEYERRYNTTFPTIQKPFKKDEKENERQQWWLDLARTLLTQDFQLKPLDHSTIKSYTIGLRWLNHPDVFKATEILKNVRAANWTKKDLGAGYLLPRKPRKNPRRK
ncbi:MAG: hypothetical protein QF745_00010 [Planctomycetota bacterium]|nr:hypothetical protein [Planctomycetota bacterium]